MIDPQTNIAVTLNAGQWNLVLGQLSEGPYRLVAPILQAIQQQCMSHDPVRQEPRDGQILPFESAS